VENGRLRYESNQMKGVVDGLSLRLQDRDGSSDLLYELKTRLQDKEEGEWVTYYIYTIYYIILCVQIYRTCIQYSVYTILYCICTKLFLLTHCIDL
jgi:hypothetical protein